MVMEKQVEDRWTTLCNFAVAGLWAAVLLYPLIHVQRAKNAGTRKPGKSNTMADHGREMLASDAATYERVMDEAPQFCAHEFHDA
jgi:hypothetical protein